MKRRTLLVVLIFVVTAPFVLRALAQTSMAAWPFYAEVNIGAGAPNTYDFLVPIQVMDKSQDQLGDLRLFDGSGREIPYALRVLRTINHVEDFGGHLFNYAEVGAASEVSVDLGEDVDEHNEVAIETTGQNFRRRVNLEGSDSGSEWRTLRADGVIFGFESANSAVESNRVSYPNSRYRYLRVRVIADEMTDRRPPVITNVKVSKVVKAQGELANWTVPVPYYESQRNNGVPTSAWTLDLGGRVPCDQLTLEIAGESFSRKFQLEVADDPENVRLVTSGQLVRRFKEERRPIVIKFDEQYARKLRLLVSDYSNDALEIDSVMASAPARQVIFELKEGTTAPVRLFFGNYNAVAPHYDFESDLAAKVTTRPNRTTIGSFFPNPDYKPEPKPLTERVPWLIYVILAASSIALALILLNLARSTLGREPLRNGAKAPD